MKFFYEIKKESAAYLSLVESEAMQKRWYDPDVQKAICEFLRVEKLTDEIGFLIDPRDLYLLEPPEHLKEQFLKARDRRGYYRAKKNLNQRWIQFTETNGLKIVDYWSPLISCIGWSTGKENLYRLNGRYVLESTAPLNNKYLEEITEAKFLELQLASLRERTVYTSESIVPS